MKNKDLKKGKESIIGKIIYGFLLFMPLLAILSTCLYTIFNKNAYKSYNNKEEAQITNLDDFKYLNTYNYHTTEQINGTITEQLSTTYTTNFLYNGNSYNYVSFWFYGSGTNILLFVKDLDNNTMLIENGRLNQYTFSFDFLRTTLNETNLNLIKPTLYKYNELTLNNTFYYSVEKTEQNKLFNWSKTTIIYTGILNTCTQLGITNTFIPMLLAYWLIISVIYILYDIILMILIILHNRVHRLQDSMS